MTIEEQHAKIAALSLDMTRLMERLPLDERIAKFEELIAQLRNELIPPGDGVPGQ